jgi:hypothetical protein
MLQQLQADSKSKWKHEDAGKHYETESYRVYRNPYTEQSPDGKMDLHMSYPGQKLPIARNENSKSVFSSKVSSHKGLLSAANRRLLDVYNLSSFKKKKNTMAPFASNIDISNPSLV